MGKKKDLFDDTAMSFGEHLEVLRIHLFKAILGLVVCVIAALFFGDRIIDVVRGPIDAALKRHGVANQAADDLGSFDLWKTLQDWWKGELPEENETAGADSGEGKSPEKDSEPEHRPVTLEIRVEDLIEALREVEPDQLPERAAQDVDPEKRVRLKVVIPELRRLETTVEESTALRPVTLNVQEAFLTYLKVSIVSGLVLASPWIFYQLWLFVAAGLYPHERRYVYTYLPLCLILFFSGAAFCFFMVFPFVLDFLLGFNKMIGVVPQIRLSEWISFALMLPLMFGLSFQLPLVMLLLERLSIFDVKDYREKRRMAILVISIVSMLMTPADPMSMLMMMVPLIGLYELGIVLCGISPARNPFPEEDE